jgi:glycosyltransferase involved in cell wall biosynthesis
MLSIVIPVCNVEDATNECIDNLQQFALGELDIIVVDNASVVPYAREQVATLRNEKNVGFWPAMQQGIAAAKSDIVLCMHNDVFVWELGYDRRILNHFQEDDKLAIAGFFGALSVGRDGGRGHPVGNMLGKKYGTHQELHGYRLTTSAASTVFDSLAMIFDREKLYTIDYKNIVPHHFCDRIVTLRLIKAGYHALTIGIAFDHGGSFTASESLDTFTEDWMRENVSDTEKEFLGNWCLVRGLEWYPDNANHTLHQYGRMLFDRELNAGALHVDRDFNYVLR